MLCVMCTCVHVLYYIYIHVMCYAHVMCTCVYVMCYAHTHVHVGMCACVHVCNVHVYMHVCMCACANQEVLLCVASGF